MTTECKSCRRKFGTITQEGLCFGCYKNKYGKVAKEFQPRGKYNG